MFKYFISYFYAKDNNTGFGNLHIVTEKIIKDIRYTSKLAEEIRKTNDMDKVIILNYQLLGRVK